MLMANKVVIRPDVRQRVGKFGYVEDVEYKMTKFRRSNQDTCINYRPIVAIGRHSQGR